MKSISLVMTCLMITMATNSLEALEAKSEDSSLVKEAQRKIGKFVSHLDLMPDVDDFVRETVYQQIESSQNDPAIRRETIHLSLTQLFGDYAKLERRMLLGRLEEARTMAKALENHKDLYLAAHARYLSAKMYLWENRYEEAMDRLSYLREKSHLDHTLYADEIMFMMAVVKHGMLERKESLEMLKSFLDKPRDVPERIAIAAQVLFRDIQMVETGALSDVHERMAYVRRQFSNKSAGNNIREQQTTIIEMLDKLIEEAKKNEGGGGGGGEGSESQPGSSPGSSGGQGGQNPNSPADSSSLPEGSSEIGDLNKKRRGSMESWGDLPPKEQAKMIQNLKGQIPGRYKDLIEQYHRSFHEADQNKENE